ncbi:MAG: hypothetical protein K1Y01_12690 [Vicinamibacteria bacterium]|nr:hypothetical protein [Vicinamibacteria bacterium]
MRTLGRLERGLALAFALVSVSEGRATEDRSGWFVRVENHVVQDLLTLGHGGGYRMSTVSTDVRATTSGTFSRRGNLLLMSAPSDRVPAQLLLVDWGSRRYLLEPSRLPAFCDFASKTRERARPRLPEMIFYRPMDEAAAFPKKVPRVCVMDGRKTKVT